MTNFGYKLSYKRIQLSLIKQINITTYFENLIIKLQDLYVFKTHIHVNRILFTILSINLYFIYNFILQKFEI